MRKTNSQNHPPLLKGFFTPQQARDARENDEILLADVFLYPECLNDCLMCCYEEKRKIKEEMDLDEYKLLLKEIAGLGVKTVFVPGMGEPLLRKKGKVFLELAEAANENGLHVVLLSSLHPTPSQELVDEFYKMDISVIGKMESMIPDTSNRIVNPRTSYEFIELKEGHIPKGLAMLLEKGFADEDRLGCGTVMNTINAPELENIFRFYRKNNIFPYMQETAPYGKAENNNFLWEGMDYRFLAERLEKIDREEFSHSWKYRRPYIAFDFDYPRVMVEYDGAIMADSYFLAKLGIVIEDGIFVEGNLTKAATSEYARKIRKIYFPRSEDPDCCTSDISQCKKILLDPDQPNIDLPEEANRYCIYHSDCR